MQWQATTILDGSSGSESVTAPQLHLASPIGKVSHRLSKLYRLFDTIVDAVGVGNKRYPDGDFSVQQVTEIPVDIEVSSHRGRHSAASA
jgi:hypothetical protein